MGAVSNLPINQPSSKSPNLITKQASLKSLRSLTLFFIYLWSIHWINWNQKLRQKPNFSVNNISTLLYTLKKKTFLPLYKVYKKVIEFSFRPAKIFWFLVFSFRFWFQLSQRIDHYFHGIRSIRSMSPFLCILFCL